MDFFDYLGNASGDFRLSVIICISGYGCNLDWSYYSLDNLQTLCKSCHRKKTNSEVKLRTKRKVKYKSNKFVGKK